MATPQERLVAWAEAQVGTAAYSGKRNKYADWMDARGMYNGPKSGYDWCDVFYDCGIAQTFGVDMVQPMLNQPKGGCGAGCEYSASYYKAMGRFSQTPKIGSQIFFGDFDHTGVVVGFNDGVVHTVEGNTGYSEGYSGGAVRERTYYRNSGSIAGYGEPRWELVEEDIVTDKDKKEIAEMAANMVISKMSAKNANGVSKVGELVWSAKNKNLETRDAYQILRDIRNALGINDGQLVKASTEMNVGYEKSVIKVVVDALSAIKKALNVK